MIAQSKCILETKAKQELEEVYSDEEGPPQFQIDENESFPIQEFSPVRQPSGVVLSGWDSQTKSKKDKSHNESPNKLARSTLWSLGENIESYHKKNSFSNKGSMHLLDTNDGQQTLTRRTHLASTTNRLLQQTSSTAPCPTRSNSNQFIDGLSEKAWEYEQNQKRNTLLLYQQIHSKQIPLKKFHLDYSVYRMRFQSAVNTDANHGPAVLTDREIVANDHLLDTTQRLHHKPLAQVLLTDVQNDSSELSRKQRASSANWYNKCLRISNEQRSQKDSNNASKQQKSVQSKMFPFSHIDSDPEENDKSKNEENSFSPEQKDHKETMKKRINLFKRSFQTAVDQAQQRLFSQGGDINTVLIGKGFQIQSHSIHNLKATFSKNHMHYSNNNNSSINESKQEISNDRINRADSSTMTTFAADQKRRSLPIVRNSTGEFEFVNPSEKVFFYDNINHHKNRSLMKDFPHSSNQSSLQNLILVDQSAVASQDGQQSNNISQLSSTRSGNQSIALKRGVSPQKPQLHSNSINRNLRQGRASIMSSDDLRNQITMQSQPQQPPKLVTGYEAHKSFKQYNIPNTLRSHILQKRFETAKKNLIGSQQQNLSQQGGKSSATSVRDEKAMKIILRQEIFKNEESNKPVVVSALVNQRNQGNSMKQMTSTQSQERVNTQSTMTSTRATERRSSQMNRIISTITPFKLQQNNIRPMTTSTSEARDSLSLNLGCIQNNFLYQKILNNKS